MQETTVTNHKYALYCPKCLAQSRKPASHVECWFCGIKDYGPQDLITQEEAEQLGVWKRRLKKYIDPEEAKAKSAAQRKKAQKPRKRQRKLKVVR